MEQRQLKIYIDENMAPQLANAIDLIQSHLNLDEKKQIKVLSIKEVFGEGVQDEDWIPKIGKEGGVVITYDRRIQQSRHQRELYVRYGVGIIFFKSPKEGLSFWGMFKKLVDQWEEIKTIARNNKPPFAFRQPGNGKPFEKWDGVD